MSTAGWCIVVGCPCRLHEVYHQFPDDEVTFDSWLLAIKNPKSKKPILFELASRVCSLHFTDDDYDSNRDGNLVLQTLKPTAIPSIFPWTKSWPFKNKKKTQTATTTVKTFSCLHCDYSTDRFRNWQRHSGNHGAKHRHRCNQCDFSTSVENGLKIHISRDHGKSRRVAKGGTGRKMPTTTSSSCAKFAAPKTARQKALQEKGSRPKKVHFAKDCGSSESPSSAIASDSDDYSSYSSSNESSDSSSSDSSVIKSASQMKLTGPSESPRANATKSRASRKGGKLNSKAERENSDVATTKHEADETPVVCNSTASDQEERSEVIESIETAVRKEVETSNEAATGD